MVRVGVPKRRVVHRPGVLAPRAASKWWAMTSVGIGVFLATIDGSIVNVALPVLARSLGASFAAVQWVVLAYLVTLLSLMMIAGRLADLWGKKRLYLLGFVVFTLGSLACGLAPGVELLVAARVVQAVGGALLAALGGAIATETFPPEERGRAMGIIGLLVSVGLISGPTLGGLLLGAFSWHAIFFVNLPLGLLGIGLAWWVIPLSPLQPQQTFDLRGAVLLTVSLVSFSLAVTLVPRGAGLWSLALAGLAVGTTRAFVEHERRAASPLLDLRLFEHRALVIPVVSGTLTFVAAAGIVLLLPFYLQHVQRRSPEEAGLLLIVSPLAMGIASPISGALSDRMGPRVLSLLGLVLLILGYLSLMTLEVETSTLGFVLRVAVIGFGMGTFQSPNNSALMGSVPRESLGVASGLLSLTRTLGQTTGIAFLGAAWAAFVHLLSAVEVADATLASASVQLHALDWTAGISVGILLLALGLVWKLGLV